VGGRQRGKEKKGKDREEGDDGCVDRNDEKVRQVQEAGSQ